MGVPDKKIVGYPARATRHPARATGYPARATGYPARATGYPARATGYPARTIPNIKTTRKSGSTRHNICSLFCKLYLVLFKYRIKNYQNKESQQIPVQIKGQPKIFD